MEDLNSYINRLQVAFSFTMRKLGPELSEAIGFTGPQFFILMLLSKQERWMVTELAERMYVKPSAITVMIDRLHQSGLVARERDENDRRIVFIRITDQGRQALQQAGDKRTQIIMKYLQHLTPDELESLANIYEKLAKIVNATGKE